jgi:putative flippase GtrA
LNTLLGIAVYGILLRFGAPYPLASGLSLALGITVGFQAHRHLVFRRHGLFVRYLAVWVCIYCLANFQIWILQRWMGPFLAGMAATPINATAAFLALRRFVFKDRA